MCDVSGRVSPPGFTVSETTDWQVVKVGTHDRRIVTDSLVTEEPIEIVLGETPLAVLMRTPGHDQDLVTGFAITEGIVLGPAEVLRVAGIPGTPNENRTRLVLAEGVHVDPERFRRNMFASSSCGVCGKASIDALRVASPPPLPGPVFSPQNLLDLPAVMSASQDTFKATGGLHSAAIFSPGGELLVIREDIGRHNAVDKVIGAQARVSWPLGEVILLVSGRISFEVVQKAAVAGIPVVCGISAASSLAVDLAEELGMTVVGFLRDESFNVYSGVVRMA